MNLPHVLLAPAALAALVTCVEAQAPPHSFDPIGWSGFHADMNASGQVAGCTRWAGSVEFTVPTISSLGGVIFLPLPAGALSGQALGINDAGVAVGLVSDDPVNWHRGEAALWTPDANGNYSVQTLGILPGCTHSEALDINNRGDIVGRCWAFPPGVQTSTLFSTSAPPIDITALGAPRKLVEINDEGVVVFYSGNAMFDIDTLTRVAYPTYPPGLLGFNGTAINDFGEVVGIGHYGSLHAITRWTRSGGWEPLTPLDPDPDAAWPYDINAHGAVTFVRLWHGAFVDLPHYGTFNILDLIATTVTEPWEMHALGMPINDAGWFAIEALHANDPSQGGCCLFRPTQFIAEAFCVGDGNTVACPCANFSEVGSEVGCLHSQGHGAWLTTTGTPEVSADDLHFHVSRARPGQSALLLQGSTQIAQPFRDGVLCMGSPTERVELLALDAGGAASTTVSIVTEGNVAPGDTRYYQVWFRDPGGISPCGSGSNFTQALMVDWQ